MNKNVGNYNIVANIWIFTQSMNPNTQTPWSSDRSMTSCISQLAHMITHTWAVVCVCVLTRNWVKVTPMFYCISVVQRRYTHSNRNTTHKTPMRANSFEDIETDNSAQHTIPPPGECCSHEMLCSFQSSEYQYHGSKTLIILNHIQIRLIGEDISIESCSRIHKLYE